MVAQFKTFIVSSRFIWLKLLRYEPTFIWNSRKLWEYWNLPNQLYSTSLKMLKRVSVNVQKKSMKMSLNILSILWLLKPSRTSLIIYHVFASSFIIPNKNLRYYSTIGYTKIIVQSIISRNTYSIFLTS